VGIIFASSYITFINEEKNYEMTIFSHDIRY